MSVSRWLSCICGLILGSLQISAETAASAPEQPPGSVIARINGKEITRSQLDEAVRDAVAGLELRGQSLTPDQRAQVETQILNQLIGRELMIEKSKTIKVDDLDFQVQTQVELVKKQFADEKAYAQELQKRNLSEAGLKEKIAEGIRLKTLIDREVRDKIQITEAEIKKFYDSNPQYFSKSAQVRASHILVQVPKDADDKVKTEKRAIIDAARERVMKGEDFGKVAAEVSEDPGSKEQGGDLGFFGKGQMVKPFEEAAFGLKSNEVSEVVTTQFGYHLIKQTDSRPASTVPLEEEKEKIENFLFQKKVQEGVMAYVETLKKSAKVEVLLKPTGASRQ